MLCILCTVVHSHVGSSKTSHPITLMAGHMHAISEPRLSFVRQKKNQQRHVPSPLPHPTILPAGQWAEEGCMTIMQVAEIRLQMANLDDGLQSS